jgi:hypothetical protein
MNRMFGRPGFEACRLRRTLSVFLLILMASDLGFHLAESLLLSSEDPSGIFLSATKTQTEPPGGCGIPGHEGTPFHHHHFPTLVSQTAMPTPLLAMASLATVPSFKIVRATTITPIGRAPPVLF